MRVQIITRNAAGCDYYRLVLPAIYLQKDAEWMKNNSIEMLWIATMEHLINCDILIYSKLIATPILVLQQLQKEGMKIVVDIDDYWVLPSNHPNTDWNNGGNDKLTIEHIRIADMVTCSSMKIQEKVRQFNKNTVVIPNAFPFGEGVFQQGICEKRDKMSFIYAGGVAHLADVRLMEGKFRRIGSDNFIKDRAEFILAGYEKAKSKKFFTKQDMIAGNQNFKIEDTRGPYDDMKTIFSHTGSYKVLPSIPVTEYINVFDQADVVLAPLMDTSWNSCKSIIKVLEAATRKLPVICSKVEPYTELEDCPHMLWAEDNDWLAPIRWCVKNPQGVKEKGELLAAQIINDYNLSKWNEARKQLLASL